MDTLDQLLSSRVKAAIFRLLFGIGESELHLREISRRAGLADGTVRQEVARLSRLGLVSLRRSGNRAYYRANRTHPLYPEIRGLVLKTSGLADVLRDALSGHGIDLAFVFGSIAAGTERPDSDVDLMVVGDTSLRQLAPSLSDAGTTLGREVNPHVFSPSEFATRRDARDHFLTTVLAGPRIWVIGSDAELAAMGRQGMA